MASEDQGHASEELPGQQSMFSSADSTPSNGKTRKRGPVHLKGTRSLERLRDRIELAVKELNRLKDENHSLHKEMDSLKSRRTESVDGTPVVFTDSPAALRSKVESFIKVIDSYIDSEESTENESED